jgi:hypothetical protein
MCPKRCTAKLFFQMRTPILARLHRTCSKHASKNNKMRTIHLLTALVSLAFATSSHATLITTPGQDVVVNFDSWAGVLPPDFTLGGPSNSTTYRGTSDTLNTGGTYNVSGFDFQASSSASSLTLTGIWQNNTGATITSLTISYDAYVVFDRTARVPTWDVTSTSGFDLSALTWTPSDGSTTLTTTISDLSIAPGETFDLTWDTDRGTGSGSTPKIGLDNITVSAQVVPEPGIVALLGLGAFAFLIRLRKNRIAA